MPFIVLGAHRVQPRIIELELLEDRIVETHLHLGRQAERDLEGVERRLQAGLLPEQDHLAVLILESDLLELDHRLQTGFELGLVLEVIAGERLDDLFLVTDVL